MSGFLSRLNSNERRFVVGVGVLVFVLLNFFLVFPHFSDWNRVRGRMEDARRKLALFQEATNKIPSLNKQVTSMQTEGAVVPPEDQAVRFARAIQDDAGLNGVGILINGGVRQVTGTNQFFVEQTQTLTVQSGEKQLVDFLYSLGSDPNSLIRVRDLSVQPEAARQQLTAHITLVASYQKKPAARTPAPAPGPKTGAAPPPAPSNKK